MLPLLMNAVAPHEQAWGRTEDMAVAVLLGVGVILTLAVVGLFIYIVTRKEGKSE